MSTRKETSGAHAPPPKSNDRLVAYFQEREIPEEVVRSAGVGYEAKVRFKQHEGPALAYPCHDRDGKRLGIHYKSVARDGERKRFQKWSGYSRDLPPKGRGKKPDDPAKVIPFGLETLEDLSPSSLVVLCCGEEDALSTRQAGYTALSQPGAGLLEPAYACEFAGLKVVLFYDAGEEEEARKDGRTLEETGTEEVFVVRWPPEAEHGADVNGMLKEDPEGFGRWIVAMVEAARPIPTVGHKPAARAGKPDAYGGKCGRRSGKPPTQAESLTLYADEMDLFHTPNGEAHAIIGVNGHRENHPVGSTRFKQLLTRQYYEESGKAPSVQALTDARATIAARAVFDGPEMPVYVRVADHEGAVYLDLCNDRWEVVEITGSGWRVVSDPPVRFVRKDNAAPLPHPIQDGSVDLLRPFVNVRTDEDFVLVVAWLVGAFNPEGPYPLLVLQGEQGSAKSTTVKVFRSLVDPAVESLRAPPRNERDLAIAASGNWTPALDNLSGFPPWLSDALCRLATGGGFATRELYSDDREVIFSAKRPVILNGIDTLAVAGDLRDRSVVVELPSIPANKKRTERDFYRDLEEARPMILGALLDAVSAALRNRDSTELEKLPRMADFAVWVVAAEEALPWEPGKFVAAYSGNRVEANELALDGDPVARAVRGLMTGREEWTGTASDLHGALCGLTDESVKRSKAWPQAPNSLSNRMKRIAPALREAGIEYGDERQPGGARTRRKVLRKIAAKDRPDRPGRQESPRDATRHAGRSGDDAAGWRDGAWEGAIPDESRTDGHGRDGEDGRDDGLRPESGRERLAL